MAIPITEHPGYGTAMAQYQAAKQQAAESGDQAQINKVELDWQTTVNKLQNDIFDRAEAEQKRNEAVAQAKALVPDIPDAVLAPLTDPAQIKAVAESLKAQADARAPVAPPAGQAPTPTPPAGAASWGVGAPTGVPTTPVDPNDPKAHQEEMRRLAEEVERDAGRAQRAQQRFGREYFQDHIAPGILKGDTYERLTGHKAVVERARQER